MSIDRQFGVHELPGTEEPAPALKRETVSAGFELRVMGYINTIWAKIGEIEAKLSEMSGSGRPMLVSDVSGARGEGASPQSPPKPRLDKPWEKEGVSRRTWYRRHKEAAP